MAFMGLFLKGGGVVLGLCAALALASFSRKGRWVCVAMISGGFDFTRAWSCGGGKVQVVREDGIAQF